MRTRLVSTRGSSVLLAITLLASLAGTRLALAATDPHGGYSSATTACASCHRWHGAASETYILKSATIRETCYTCHNGTGAASNVKSEFGDNNSGASTRVSSHPVPGGTLTCSDCHSPHKGTAADVRLLRMRLSDGTYGYSPPGTPIGNAFCTSCHGPSSAYPAPLGDHSGFEASIHNQSGDVPAPASGSGIKCLACHASHGSDLRRLQTAEAPGLCFTCHTQATPRTAGGSNPYVAFNGTANDYSTADGNGVRVFHHPVAAADRQGSTRVVACASCHNVHLVDATDDGTSKSKIEDPSDTNQKYLVTWTASGQTKGNISNFCLRCHVAPTTTQPLFASPSPFVPYSISLVNDTFGDADLNTHDKFVASSWTGTEKHGPSNGSGNLACTACHDSHGSSNAFMLRENVVSPDGSASNTVSGYGALNTEADRGTLQTFCTTCHSLPGTHADPSYAGLCTKCHYHTGTRF